MQEAKSTSPPPQQQQLLQAEKYQNICAQEQVVVKTEASVDTDTASKREAESAAMEADGCANVDSGTTSGADDAAITPSKKNKRKMTEPKRRTTDFSIRSICSSSDTEELKDDREDEEAADDAGSHTTGSSFPSVFHQQQRLFQVDLSAVHSSLTGYRTPVPSNVGSFLFPPGPFTASNNDKANSIDRRITGMTITVSGGAGLPPPSPTTSAYGRDSPDLSPVMPEDASRSSSGNGRRPRKNYKNMTKQRRIEANARERTRVHTISAAFESLRRAVPSYSFNQRLSKLAILRIACSYILALARLADLDYSQEQSSLSFSDCVELCTQTIQAEGKAKRRH